MNIFNAEIFRYRKSFYGRMVYILIIPFAAAVAMFLKYVSGGVSESLLTYIGFTEESVKALCENMSGVSYMASSLSAADLLMLVTMLPVIIHITDDYEQGTIRYEQQRSGGRTKCYIARAFAAAVFSVIVLAEYMLVSGIISLIFFGNNTSKEDISKLLITFVAQCFVTAACTLFIHMLVTAIRHQVVSMAAGIILILLFTPGLNMLTDFLGMDVVGEIWIVSMLTMTSNFTADASMLLYMFIVSAVYGLVSILLGAYAYKKQKI